MADKPITLENLLALAKEGANIKLDQKPSFVAQVDPSAMQFEKLLAKLDAMMKINESRLAAALEIVKINELRIAADLARFQSQVELLSTLQRTIKDANVIRSQNAAPPPSVDLAPLKSVLTEIQKNTLPGVRSSYEFTVHRNRQHGFIESISAMPNTKH